jgi:hypothetical protein
MHRPMSSSDAQHDHAEVIREIREAAWCVIDDLRSGELEPEVATEITATLDTLVNLARLERGETEKGGE